MDHHAAVTRHYDARAATYDDIALHRELVDVIAADLPPARPGSLVVDVATGTGLLLRALGPAWPGARLGVDRSPGMLGVARATLPPDVALVLADAAALPVASGSVDLLTCVTALHLLPDPAAAFAEWRRALRPGGHLVTATFGPAPEAAPEPDRMRRDFERRHDDYRTVGQVAAALAPYGLTVTGHRAWAYEGEELLVCSATRDP
jgi:ubiquinone/menaquinone biosynthesis C-methylase UbiE